VILLSSCKKSAENSEQETEAQTEKAELKEFADPALISKIKEGMSKKELENLLGAYPIETPEQKAMKYYVYRFTDGRIVYVTFGDNKGGSITSASFKIDYAIDPALADSIKIGDTATYMFEVFGSEGVRLTNHYGNYTYILADGRIFTAICSLESLEDRVDYVIEKIDFSSPSK
jgi:outer membrane protein assembly factor BamE (lipoprotein component of BamABCDE complex)